MPIYITLTEGTGWGRSESERHIGIVGDNEYRHAAIPAAAKFSVAVESAVSSMLPDIRRAELRRIRERGFYPLGE